VGWVEVMVVELWLLVRVVCRVVVEVLAVCQSVGRGEGGVTLGPEEGKPQVAECSSGMMKADERLRWPRVTVRCGLLLLSSTLGPVCEPPAYAH
jgi:hypothetical protein